MGGGGAGGNGAEPHPLNHKPCPTTYLEIEYNGKFNNSSRICQIIQNLFRDKFDGKVQGNDHQHREAVSNHQ